jgi:hypothetical protein
MNKLLGLLLAIAIVVAVVPSRSLGAPPSPPGIPAKNWVPLGDVAGFVITPPLSGDPRPPAGMVKGYFVVRQGNIWLRVDADRDVQVQPATITR